MSECSVKEPAKEMEKAEAEPPVDLWLPIACVLVRNYSESIAMARLFPPLSSPYKSDIMSYLGAQLNKQKRGAHLCLVSVSHLVRKHLSNPTLKSRAMERLYFAFSRWLVNKLKFCDVTSSGNGTEYALN